LHRIDAAVPHKYVAVRRTAAHAEDVVLRTAFQIVGPAGTGDHPGVGRSWIRNERVVDRVVAVRVGVLDKRGIECAEICTVVGEGETLPGDIFSFGGGAVDVGEINARAIHIAGISGHGVAADGHAAAGLKGNDAGRAAALVGDPGQCVVRQ